MLTLTKLVSAEYLITSVADGMEDYYMGAGEAPGVWHGRWAAELGLEGVVEADQLRRLVEGRHPATGADLLAGRPARKVNAFDVTLSCPKSVSLLWAFGTDETSSTVSIAQAEATSRTIEFLEGRAAVARQQTKGVRRRVATHGFAVAAFVHRTSRDGDPQLHAHCFIPNVIQRVDGTHVSFDANVLHEWAKPAGTIFQNELQRLLTERLGIEWGPERNGTREITGFTREQLRRFSKRSVAIEAELEAAGEEYLSPAARMRADDRASLATRRRKDKALTPERLRSRWGHEAHEVGIDPGTVERAVCSRAGVGLEPPGTEVFAALVDPETGVCASKSSFGEADVVTRIAAMSGGRLTTPQVVSLAGAFLASEHVIRLASQPGATQRRPPAWSTVAHRQLEDRVLLGLRLLTGTPASPIGGRVIGAALDAHPSLGEDQAEAVRALCGPGPSVRTVLAPAGHGKTTAVRAAVAASEAAGRQVLALATTNKAVAELRHAGVEACTIARFGLDVGAGTVAPDTTVIVDEVSQVSTKDAAVVLDAIVNVPGTQLWCIGDPRQAQAVRAAGLAATIEHLAADGSVPAAALTVNRRQEDPRERDALTRFRAGDISASQAVRTEHGWEHEHPTPEETRGALAATAVAATERHGAEGVAVLAVSHADCEDLADRIRVILDQRGELGGWALEGPAWGSGPRRYATGDRVLFHDSLRLAHRRLHNGSTGTVTRATSAGLDVRLDDGGDVHVPAWFVQGTQPNGDPNLSHAWARAVEGAQGGTWTQVHLLGTASLDRFRGYVGQSRGRQPTHTWNVTRTPDDDHGGLAPDERTAAEQVLDALGREPTKTFASDRDPWVPDRALSTERAEHTRVIATRPPDRRLRLTEALDARRRAEHEVVGAEAFHRGARDRAAAVGPLAGLRRSGRDAKERAEAELLRATDRLERAHERVTQLDARIVGIEHEIAARRQWDEQHGWRIPRVAAIDDELRHHWAGVVLAAARDDDPLAFGPDRLREARATFAADLRRLVDSLPPDRTPQLGRAESELHRRQEELRHITQGVSRDRRWTRAGRTGAVVAELESAHEAAGAAVELVRQERSAVRERHEAVRQADPARREIACALETLSTALKSIEPPLTDPAVAQRGVERDLGIDLGL